MSFGRSKLGQTGDVQDNYYRVEGGFTYRPAPLLQLYSQSVSLQRVDFFGLGPNSSPVNHTTFGFSENISGASLILPTS